MEVTGSSPVVPTKGGKKMTQNEKFRAIEQALSTDKGIENIAEAASSIVTDPMARAVRKAHMIALLNLQRCKGRVFKQ